MISLRYFRSMILATCLVASANVQAQMVGGSVFLKGAYVEAGICANGDFGAASPPAGYHPHTISGGGGALGFVADPAMDGWTVGTPAYMGDYFTPGTPFEGWNLQIGSIRAQAHSCAGFTGTGLSGANTAYAVSGSKVIGTWEGSFDSMTVRQETTLDTNDLFFSLKITLINTASVPKNNIYYLRSVDPDNDQSWPGGGFFTFNTIQYQRPNPLNATVVRARGGSSTAPVLSLGTADTNARCLIYDAWPISSTVDLSTLYNMTMGSATYVMGGTRDNDIAIGIVFKVDHLAPIDSASDSVGMKPTVSGRHPANQASFTYFYSFSDAATDSALAELSAEPEGPVEPTFVTNHNAGAVSPVSIYPNPAGDLLNIKGVTSTDKVMLFDMMGRAMPHHWAIEDKELNTVSLQQFPPGNYVLIVKDQFDNPRVQIPLRKR